MPATKRDYYDVLGIGRESDGAEVKRAFRMRARVLHPDVSDDPEATAKFAELAEAYDVLSKSRSRLLYDRFGYRGRGEFAAVEPAANDLFEFLAKNAANGRRRRIGEVQVSEHEAERGARRTIEYETTATCRTCAGSGAAAGSKPRLCSRCRGRGRTRQGSTLAGDRVLQIDICPSCDGRGRVVAESCPACDGSGRSTTRRRTDVLIPAGASEGQRLEAGEPGSLMYVVVHVRELPEAVVVRWVSLAGLALACLFLLLVIRF